MNKKYKIVVEQQGWRLGFFEVDGLSEEDVKQRYQTTDDLEWYMGVSESDNWHLPQFTVGVTVTDVEEAES